jgi:hypothetical protein
MSDHLRTERSDAPTHDLRSPAPPPSLKSSFVPLPGWLARRLLRKGEHVTWVRGPRLNPPWERYVTHPALILAALLPAVVGGLSGLPFAGSDLSLLVPVLVVTTIILGCILILVVGIFVTYFTRLVVTNQRVLIVQGYEVARSWKVEDLPLSLVRYGVGGDGRDGEPSRTVDLEAIQTMLGRTSDKFTDAKTIVAFGKQLDQITSREPRRP